MNIEKKIPPDRTDYHVHCHLDGCAARDMTLAAIYEEAVRAGLREICVVKHYSHALPNGGDAWINWKRTRPEDFDRFLAEFEATPQPAGLSALSGVETELLDAEGNINITPEAAARIDLILLSNHWLPEGPGLSTAWQPLLTKGVLPCQMEPNDLAPWLEAVRDSGPAPFTKAVCDGNAAAVARHDKVRILAHLGDGFHALRAFRVPVDELDDDTLLELAAPVMDACARHGALWELTPSKPLRTAVVREADRRGVSFTGTVDAHFLRNPAWGHTLAQHEIVERTIAGLGLRRACLSGLNQGTA